MWILCKDIAFLFQMKNITGNSSVLLPSYTLNIEFTEKIQAQSAHYSGRQQTCHCSLIEGPTGKMYVYHLSDDTNHDSIMTFTIIRDLIKGILQLLLMNVLSFILTMHHLNISVGMPFMR